MPYILDQTAYHWSFVGSAAVHALLLNYPGNKLFEAMYAINMLTAAYQVLFGSYKNKVPRNKCIVGIAILVIVLLSMLGFKCGNIYTEEEGF